MDVPGDRKSSYLECLLEQITPHKALLFNEKAALRTRRLTIVLENLFQAHNASAVLRSCDCFGVQDVHVIEKTNPFSTSHEISLGSSRWLSIHRYSGEDAVQQCYSKLRTLGYTIYAASPHKNDVNLETMECSVPLALVFGTEMQGLSEEALHSADGYMKIPMVGFTESLNVSVSAAVCMHHLTWKMREQQPSQFGLSLAEQLDLKIAWAERSFRHSAQLKHQFLSDLTSE